MYSCNDYNQTEIYRLRLLKFTNYHNINSCIYPEATEKKSPSLPLLYFLIMNKSLSITPLHNPLAIVAESYL